MINEHGVGACCPIGNPPEISSQAKISREHLAAIANLLIQLANDPTRTGVLLTLHEDGDVSLSSKGAGNVVGQA
jgi:hypothetical protein